MVQALNALFTVLELAVLARVLYSWVDPNPYSTNQIKQLLWAVTDPILEPIRRVLPPVGMIDLSPVVALVGLQIIQRVLIAALIG